jgi:uncharacterized membrane protein
MATKTVADDFADKLLATLNESEEEIRLNEEVFTVQPVTNTKLFVGQDDERELFIKAIAACIQGVYKKIAIFGDSGVGKTSLINIAIDAGKKSNKYLTINLNKSDYDKGEEECYRHIIFELVRSIGNTLELKTRDDESAKLTNHCFECGRKILLDDLKNTEDILNFAKTHFASFVEKLNESTSKLNSSPEPENYLLISYLHSLLSPQRVMVVLDDVYKLDQNRHLMQEILRLTNRDFWFYVLAMPSETFNKLRLENDDLLKDVVLIQVNPLEIQECKELLRRRILDSQKKALKINSEPDYSRDLRPFTEKAVEIMASACDCHPLNFVRLLKSGWLKARDNRAKIIDEEIALDVAYPNTPKNVVLTEKQKLVFEYIRSKRMPVTMKEIASITNTSGVAAFFTLRDLVNLGLIKKQRDGGRVSYFFESIKAHSANQ